MNFNDPKQVIETMCLLTNDAHDVSIDVEYETIIVRAAGDHNSGFSMRWSYPGYGNERVRQIAKDYHLVLMKAQREEDIIDDMSKDWLHHGQEVEFSRMNGNAIETCKGHVISIDKDGIIEVHAFNKSVDGVFKYRLKADEIHKPH